MKKDDLKWVVGLIVGLLAGMFVTYATLKVDDAVLNTRVAQLESSCQQHRSDINIIRVELSKTQTEMKNTDESYRSLKITLKEVADSTRDVAIALVRIEERQAKSDAILESLSEEIKFKRDKDK